MEESPEKDVPKAEKPSRTMETCESQVFCQKRVSAMLSFLGTLEMRRNAL